MTPQVFGTYIVYQILGCSYHIKDLPHMYILMRYDDNFWHMSVGVIYSHIQSIGFDSILGIFLISYCIDVRTKVVSYHNLWGYQVTEWRKNTFSKLYLNIGYRIFMFSYMNTSAWSLRNCYIHVLYIACSHITTASMFVYTMFAYHCVW